MSTESCIFDRKVQIKVKYKVYVYAMIRYRLTILRMICSMTKLLFQPREGIYSLIYVV